MPRRRTRGLACALMHPIRATLRKYLHGRERVTLEELGGALGLDRAVVHYHVRVLADCGEAKLSADGSVS